MITTIFSDIKNEFFQKNPISLYIKEENRCRSEQEWPLSDIITTKYYLYSDGSESTFNGEVKLSKINPKIKKNKITIYQTLLIQSYQ